MAPLAQCLRDLNRTRVMELINATCVRFVMSHKCATLFYRPSSDAPSPRVTVPPKETGLQLGEDEAELGFQSEEVLDQPALIAHADPQALQILLHHLLKLPDSLLNVEIQAGIVKNKEITTLIIWITSF